MPELTTLSTGHLREFFNSLHKRGNKPASVSVHYRGLQLSYKWLVTEGERPDNPVARTCPSRARDATAPIRNLDFVLLTVPVNTRPEKGVKSINPSSYRSAADGTSRIERHSAGTRMYNVETRTRTGRPHVAR